VLGLNSIFKPPYCAAQFKFYMGIMGSQEEFVHRSTTSGNAAVLLENQTLGGFGRGALVRAGGGPDC
jgi:hypothetical protein